MKYNYSFIRDVYGRKIFYGGIGLLSFFVFAVFKYRSSWESFLPIAIVGGLLILVGGVLFKKGDF